MKKILLVFGTLPEALEKADIVAFLVAHKEFKNLDVQTELHFSGVLNK